MRVAHRRDPQPKDALTTMSRDGANNNTSSTDQCWRFAVVPNVLDTRLMSSTPALLARKRLDHASSVCRSHAHMPQTTPPKPRRAKQSPCNGPAVSSPGRYRTPASSTSHPRRRIPSQVSNNANQQRTLASVARTLVSSSNVNDYAISEIGRSSPTLPLSRRK